MITGQWFRFNHINRRISDLPASQSFIKCLRLDDSAAVANPKAMFDAAGFEVIGTTKAVASGMPDSSCATRSDRGVHGAPDSRHAGHTSLHDHSRHARHPCPMAIAPAWDHSAPPLPRFALPGRSRALQTYAPGRHRDGRGSWFNSLMKALLPGRRHVARHTVGYVTNQHYAGRHRG